MNLSMKGDQRALGLTITSDPTIIFIILMIIYNLSNPSSYIFNLLKKLCFFFHSNNIFFKYNNNNNNNF